MTCAEGRALLYMVNHRRNMLDSHRTFRFATPFIAILLLALTAHAAAGASDDLGRTYLHKNWALQSSCEIKASGQQISAPGFDAGKWHHADVPSTVVGALVTDKTYPDPNYATNLKSLPGMNYSAKTFFSNQDMPQDSPFRCSWWFRTEFATPLDSFRKTTWLHFLGINYRANVW